MNTPTIRNMEHLQKWAEQSETAKGKWVWGQFAPLIPAEDFRDIVNKAIQKGWI